MMTRATLKVCERDAWVRTESTVNAEGNCLVFVLLYPLQLALWKTKVGGYLSQALGWIGKEKTGLYLEELLRLCRAML